MISAQAAKRARAAPSKVATRRKDDACNGFNAETFLATAGVGRTLLNLKKDDALFAQGDPADTIFYIQSGRVKLTVVAASGKEATLALLSAGDFVGEQCVTGGHPIRLTTARAMSDCALLRISRAEMVRVLHQQHAMSDVFVGFLLARNARIQEDLVDQLFNSSEKRLARVLLLLAHFGKDGKTEEVIPQDQPGGARGDGRHEPLPRKFLHEPLSETGIHSIRQRRHGDSQLAAERHPARLGNALPVPVVSARIVLSDGTETTCRWDHACSTATGGGTSNGVSLPSRCAIGGTHLRLFHEAADRLLQLRIDLIRDRHHIEQQ
jgi:CRP-like cAMP-binding protein